jgi:hypothetical protein
MIVPTPRGLYQRYAIQHADGTQCDPDAVYFVLRLNSTDLAHRDASIAAAEAYAAVAKEYHHLRQVGIDLEKIALDFAENRELS